MVAEIRSAEEKQGGQWMVAEIRSAKEKEGGWWLEFVV